MLITPLSKIALLSTQPYTILAIILSASSPKKNDDIIEQHLVIADSSVPQGLKCHLIAHGQMNELPSIQTVGTLIAISGCESFKDEGQERGVRVHLG